MVMHPLLGLVIAAVVAQFIYRKLAIGGKPKHKSFQLTR
jgi:hypothetical protein